jgi:hypothetical protein
MVDMCDATDKDYTDLPPWMKEEGEGARRGAGGGSQHGEEAESDLNQPE